MIKSIRIANIQSHKDTVLEFSEGINCIVGSSNAGKTVVLRSLYWLRYNRPLGLESLASHWALTDKGELIGEMSVAVETDRGTVARRRTKTDNQYIVNGRVLNVVKSDVPAEVENALCLTETNIQRQMDAPFLLSSTSGEVAKYFNRVVRLDVIDRILSGAESRKRKFKAEITAVEGDIADCEAKLAEFGWLDKAERLIGKYERAQARNKELHDTVDGLKSQLADYELRQSVINRFDFSVQKALVAEIEKEKERNSRINTECWALSNSIARFEDVKVYPDFGNQKEIIQKLLDYSPDRKKVGELNESFVLYALRKKQIDNLETKSDALKGQLPKICPLCGSPMELCRGQK